MKKVLLSLCLALGFSTLANHNPVTHSAIASTTTVGAASSTGTDQLLANGLPPTKRIIISNQQNTNQNNFWIL